MTDETLLEFPCDYPLKVVGRNTGDFVQLVTGIIARHAGAVSDDQVSTRPSRDGNYLAVTCTIRAQNKPQLDALYAELAAHEQILMVL